MRKGLTILILPLLSSIATPPVALHQLIEVEKGDEVVLHLHGHDLDGDKVRASFKHFAKYFLIASRKYFNRHYPYFLNIRQQQPSRLYRKAVSFIKSLTYLVHMGTIPRSGQE